MTTGWIILILFFLGCFLYGAAKAVRDLQVQKDRSAGWLYFIGNTRGPIKVGITRGTPEERMSDLQTGNPTRLKLLYAMRVKNLEEAEGRAHNLLADAHVGGEWYQREAVMGLLWALKSREDPDLNNIVQV